MRSLDQFYLSAGEPNGSCFSALRSVILSHDTRMTEALKYSMPFFSFDKKMFCYFWIDKKNDKPYIGFKNAVHLSYPWLETGTRTRFSIMYIDPEKDLPVDEVRITLDALINLTEKLKK